MGIQKMSQFIRVAVDTKHLVDFKTANIWQCMSKALLIPRHHLTVNFLYIKSMSELGSTVEKMLTQVIKGS